MKERAIREGAADELSDLLLAFTEHIEASHAALLKEVQGENQRLRQELEAVQQEIQTLRSEAALLAGRLDAVEERLLALPIGGGALEGAAPDRSEAEERIRWRHPEIWKMVQDGLDAETIAARSGRTLGELRLILRLMGKPAKTRPPKDVPPT